MWGAHPTMTFRSVLGPVTLASAGCCFLLAAGTYLLQLDPRIGVFLMMLAAPFWPGALINLGFAALLFAAFARGLWRVLSLAPVLWYGGYAVWSQGSRAEAADFTATIARFNAGKRVRWEPARQTVLLVHSEQDEQDGSPLRASTLVDSFGLSEVVYQRGNAGAIRASFVTLSPCPGRGSGVTGELTYSHPSDGGYGTGRPLRFAERACRYDGPPRAPQPTITIRTGDPVRTETAQLTTWRQTITVTVPGRPPLRLQAGWAEPLRRFPSLLLGCALDSGAPAWRCFRTFLKQNNRFASGPTAPDVVVARALGLRRIALIKRHPDWGWTEPH